MKLEQAKALFMAQYLGQKVFTHDKYGEEGPVENDTMRISWILQPGVRDDGYYLLLRSVSQLTDEEILSIGKNIGWGISLENPNPNVKTMVLENVKRDFCNPQSMIGVMKDHLKLLGVLTSFTYLNDTNTPITLQPHEIIAMGWVKLLTD